MEIEQSPRVVPKKLWKIVRIMLCMLRKGISNSKSALMVDFHMMLKRGKIASKAIFGNLIHHQHYHYSPTFFTCRSDDVVKSFISPGEYEFSCSNSPFYYKKRKNQIRPNYYPYKPRGYGYKNKTYEVNEVAQKVFEMLNHHHHHEMAEQSPLMMLPGLEYSPMVRQLRVTDSPFSVKEIEEKNEVDKEAEEFINKFYKKLKQETKVAALEPPSPYHLYMG